MSKSHPSSLLDSVLLVTWGIIRDRVWNHAGITRKTPAFNDTDRIEGIVRGEAHAAIHLLCNKLLISIAAGHRSDKLVTRVDILLLARG